MSSSHHGETPEVQRVMKRFLEQAESPFRREFPQGMISADDDGEIAFAVASDDSKELVVINFNKPVAWLAMPPDQAMQLAGLLMKHAKSVSKKPLTVEV